MSTFKIEVFLQDLENDLSEGEFNFNDNVNDQFGKCLAIFCKCVDNSAPIRKASRKENKLHGKPWISRGLLKSIKKKNKLFTNLHKNRNEESFIHYKLYRNTLHRAIKPSKQKLLLKAKNQTNYPTMTSLMTSQLSSTHKFGKTASIVVWIYAKSHINAININKQKIHV